MVEMGSVSQKWGRDLFLGLACFPKEVFKKRACGLAVVSKNLTLVVKGQYW